LSSVNARRALSSYKIRVFLDRLFDPGPETKGKGRGSAGGSIGGACLM